MTIELPEEIVRELRRLAAARGTDPGNIVAEVLDEALRRRQLAREDLGALLDELATRQQASGDILGEDEARELVVAEQHALRAESSPSRPPRDD